MPNYLVRWEIDQDAPTPRQAAQAAWRNRSAPGSIANVFTVINTDTEAATLVDLHEPDAPPGERTGPPVFGFALTMLVTGTVSAPSGEAARALVDGAAFEVTALGTAVCEGRIAVSSQTIRGCEVQ
ncbi:hypothetical protein [Actinomadura atramentaria]|uniref:hypothetical protein n=1 Tax=Actinomadura atramentaria TaxID=1990 RepID=UPI0003AAEF2D|nr:hypothetical protein [Actinomadura atramentaria]